MILSHVIVLLREDCDMLAVQDIVKAYKGAKIDNINNAVFLNDNFRTAQDFLEEIHPFTIATRLNNEVI